MQTRPFSMQGSNCTCDRFEGKKCNILQMMYKFLSIPTKGFHIDYCVNKMSYPS